MNYQNLSGLKNKFIIYNSAHQYFFLETLEENLLSYLLLLLKNVHVLWLVAPFRLPSYLWQLSLLHIMLF